MKVRQYMFTGTRPGRRRTCSGPASREGRARQLYTLQSRIYTKVRRVQTEGKARRPLRTPTRIVIVVQPSEPPFDLLLPVYERRSNGSKRERAHLRRGALDAGKLLNQERPQRRERLKQPLSGRLYALYLYRLLSCRLAYDTYK